MCAYKHTFSQNLLLALSQPQDISNNTPRENKVGFPSLWIGINMEKPKSKEKGSWLEIYHQ